MPKEYEYNFHEFNKEEIIRNIKKHGGKKFGIFLFRVMLFIHPLNNKNSYIRVRDEGHRITMTYKKVDIGEFQEEDEIIIDNFDSAVKILIGIGCKKKFYYEKIREIYYIGNTEIDFQMDPGKQETMEIESTSRKELDNIVKKIGVDKKNRIKNKINLYNEKFGIIIPPTIDLTFLNSKKCLLPLLKKNKKEFLELVKKQKELYKSILKIKK